MNISLKVNGSEISSAVIKADVAEKLNGGAAILTFSVLKSVGESFSNGADIVFAVEGRTFFCGKIFLTTVYNELTEFSAMDSLSALRAAVPIMRYKEQVSDFVKRLLAVNPSKISVGEIEKCTAFVDEKKFSKISALSIIYRTLNEVKDATRFVLRDEQGKICLRDEKSLKCSLVMNDSVILSIRYEKNAAEAVNYVKIVSNSIETAGNIVSVLKNSSLLDTFGANGIVYELFLKNAEQIAAAAKQKLLNVSKESEKFSIKAVGNTEARAGCLVWTELDGVGKFWARITRSAHVFEGNSHIMQLELERI